MKAQAILLAVLGTVLLQAPISVFADASRGAASQVAKRAHMAPAPPLRSSAFVVADQQTGEILLERNGNAVLPIASITKLMTAIVVLEAGQSMSERISVTNDDIDRLKGTSSRLAVGTRLTRQEMLHLALMSSENRAASALGRHYPGGEKAFISAMNAKARLIGLFDTRFADGTGLNPKNVSSPRDLVRLVSYASTFPLIRQYTTADNHQVTVGKGQTLRYRNTNGLIRDDNWSIGLSKTGFIREAGRCLVMQAWMLNRPVVIVLLQAGDRQSRTADANEIRRWMETWGAERMVEIASAKAG